VLPEDTMHLQRLVWLVLVLACVGSREVAGDRPPGDSVKVVWGASGADVTVRPFDCDVP